MTSDLEAVRAELAAVRAELAALQTLVDAARPHTPVTVVNASPNPPMTWCCGATPSITVATVPPVQVTR